MKDERLKAAFEWGAGSAAPAPELWGRVQGEITARSRRRRMQSRILVAAAVLLFFATGTLTLSPTVRAAVKGAIVTLWQTRFGATPVQLDWDSHHPEQSEHYTWQDFADPAQAAAYLGFPPALASAPEATRSDLQAHRGVEATGFDVRIARVTYTVPRAPFPFAVETTGWYQADGTPLPLQELKLTTRSEQQPVNIREEQVGGARAMCFELSGTRLTGCFWLKDGFRIGVSGPDPAMVLKLARSVVQ